MTMQEVTLYQASPLSERAQYAMTLAGASDLIPKGLFDKQTGRPSPAKILLVMETGAMLGLAPMAALAGIDVIEGRASISPRVLLGLLRSAGHKVRIREFGTLEEGTLGATVTLIRSDDPDEPIAATFTVKDALQAGLVDSYGPDANGVWHLRARSGTGKVLPWEAYPQDLVVWRAASRMSRRGGQDVAMGIGYIPEELEIEVDEEGFRREVDAATEDTLIEEFQAYTDRGQMRGLWRREHPLKVPTSAWIPRVQAAFDAHLSTLPDDRAPKAADGGEAGVPAGEPAEAGEQSTDATPTPETGAESVEPAADPATGEVVDAEVVAEPGEMTEEQIEAWNRAEAERMFNEEQAAQQAEIEEERERMAHPRAAAPTKKPFDGGALEGVDIP